MRSVAMLPVVVLLAGIGQAAIAQQATQSDGQRMTSEQVRIAVQGICPVSGQKPGAHGQPVKAKLGDEELFLCCRGCLQGEVNVKHWNTIHANFASAQAKCPVMNKALPGSPKWTIVEGRIVYVCCPGCIRKIQADPKTYLQKVDELYSASLRAKRNPR